MADPMSNWEDGEGELGMQRVPHTQWMGEERTRRSGLGNRSSQNLVPESHREV